MRENDYRWTQFKKRASRSLGLDNDTRWNSWFLLLDVALNLQEHVEWYQRKQYENLLDDYLTLNEWGILRETRAFLQQFWKITQLTEGRYATLDRTLFTMDVLHRHYTQAFQKYHDNPPLRSCVAASWAVFDNYAASPITSYGPCSEKLAQVVHRSVLDGVMKYWEDHYQKLPITTTTPELRDKLHPPDEYDLLAQELDVVSPASNKLDDSVTRSCVMRRSQNLLRFGDYRFVLEFVVQGQDKIKVRASGYPGLHPSPSLNPTPPAYSKTSWNIWLHNKIPNTSITSGVNIYTGEPVAVKELENKTALLPYTSNRLRVARRYDKKRDKGLLGIIDVWCDHNMSPPCFSDRRKKVDDDSCERIFYYMPLAKNNFRDMPWVDLEFKERLALFYQTLIGLAELHRQKIIHGNILPESLLILTESEPITKGQFPSKRAVISLNMRKRKKNPDESVCIAPEVWENGNDQELDETKLDIWALATSWLFAFTVPPENVKIKKKSYGGLKITLDTQAKNGFIKKPLVRLLRRMLALEPQDRPSATDALADEVWKPIKDQKQEEKDSRKRKRAETIKGDSKDKRVRVLSPDVDE
ncbi:hypothetical protein THAR02_08767 [Trichoderma harzianum]|uniref:non-specific serine/threonine protein kinase n=1 Tax=Trichoderma harzianum TaxID=5544 RepID=A0A0G0A1F1_TRIHA|nr:hypothetical protein THAR02_08767 [Trichoderma harzianum]